MTKYSDEMKWACLDSELSAAESSAMAESLPQEEWQKLEGEMRLEAGIAEVLGTPAACPPSVWKAARNLIGQAGHERLKMDRRGRTAFMACAAAAAMLLIGVFGVLWGQPWQKNAPGEKAEFLFLRQPDVPSLAALSQISGEVPDARAFLEQKAIRVLFDPMDVLEAEGSPYRLLGAREDLFRGERIVQLLFDHDGTPAKIVITQMGGAAAAEIGKALAGGNVRASRPVGNVITAVVGQTASRDLLAFFEDPEPEPEMPLPDRVDGAPDVASFEEAPPA